MIIGRIRNREAIIGIEVLGPGRQPQRIEAVIDSGFNGYLTLPEDLVAALHLPFAGYRRAKLADDSITRLRVYLAGVVWHGQPKEVLISQTAGTPLIGMSLLEGNRLTMNVVEHGDVMIEELSQ